MATSKDVAQYVIEAYTKYGVEIQSTGDESIILNLPPMFRDITELCEALHEEFGCIVDLEYDNSNLRAKVWTTHMNSVAETQPTAITPSQDSSVLISFVKIAIFVCLLAIVLKIILSEELPQQNFKKVISKLIHTFD